MKSIDVNTAHLERAKEFLSKIHVKQINLLPYHKIGMDKYNRVGMEYKMMQTEEPSKESMEVLKKSFMGFTCASLLKALVSIRSS